MSSPRILGWTPSSPEGDVVDVVPQASCQFIFQLDDIPKSSPAHSGEAPSSPPSVGLLTPSAAEPEKIPRPPNSFIIFRSEFTKLRKSQQGVSSAGLSRQAGDAWNLLSPEEKLPYRRRAELEKQKHARTYPNYQYRPRRLVQKSGSRRTPPPPKRRRPSPALTIRTMSEGSMVEQPPSSPETERVQLVMDPAVKADRRRSSSVPVTSGEHVYSSAFLPEERWQGPERPTQSKRRSRSVTQDWVSFTPSFQVPQPTFDPRSPQTEVFSSQRHPSHGTVNPAALFAPAQHMSPLAAVASSLAGWNGAVPWPCPTPPAPIAPQPMRLNAPSWLCSPETVLMYEPAPSPDGEEDLRSLAGSDQWPLEPQVYGTPSSWDGSARQHFKAASNPEDYARAAALQEYEHGLQERVYGMAYPRVPNADFTFSGLELDFEPASDSLQF